MPRRDVQLLYAISLLHWPLHFFIRLQDTKFIVHDPFRYPAASFFVSYLISHAFFGLFRLFSWPMPGGAWDNAKKVVEVDMKEKRNRPA